MAKKELSITNNTGLYHRAYIDVGNTQTKIVYRNNIEYVEKHINNRNMKNLVIKPVEKIILSSVVPSITAYLKAKYANLHSVERAELNIMGLSPNIGIDRCVNLYASKALYDEKNVIVLDMGTATTITCMKDNEFIGGLIFPGMGLLASSLHTHTAQLPLVQQIMAGSELLAKETEVAMRAGIVNIACRGINESLKAIIKAKGEKFLVVGTGGYILAMTESLHTVNIINHHLLLKGLEALYP